MVDRASGLRPLLVHEPEIARRLAARFQIAHLLTRHSERHVWALFMFLNGFATIGLLAAVAMASRTPFVFPSLGPTAFLFFFTPRAPAASPRHTIYGHAIGIVCGLRCSVAVRSPACPAGDVHRRLGGAGRRRRIVAGLKWSAHDSSEGSLPAGWRHDAHYLSLGIVTRPFHLLVIEIAVVILTLQAIAINRLAGIDYPCWARRDGVG